MLKLVQKAWKCNKGSCSFLNVLKMCEFLNVFAHVRKTFAIVYPLLSSFDLVFETGIPNLLSVGFHARKVIFE